MKKTMKRGLSLLLALVLCIGLAVGAGAAGSVQYYELVLEDTAEYLKSVVQEPTVSSVGGEWAVLGLARSGCDVPEGYYQGYYANLVKTLQDTGGTLDAKLNTEFCRVIVALAALGTDARDVAGYDLTLPLGDYTQTLSQGLNGPIWALIALDSRNYPVPTAAAGAVQATRDLYVGHILSCQLADGGWHLIANSPEAAAAGKVSGDPDITAMALQALAKYQDRPEVQNAIDKALSFLSGKQDATGGFSSWGTSNSESISQTITALCELGISYLDPRFVKDGHSLLDALMSYENQSGGFKHTGDGKVDQMATEQAFYALVDLWRTDKGKNSLFRMGDAAAITLASGTSSAPAPGTGLPGKNAAVTPRPVTKPDLSFSDISASPNKAAIEALTAREIINGMGDGTFAPDATMTRAQYATIVVKALGLTPDASGAAAFTDVPAGSWFASYVGTACTCGIVNGRGGGVFDPQGTITRQEAAVMTVRAAKLCGLDTALGDPEIRDHLSEFADYVTVASWAKENMAWCYKTGVLDTSDLNVEPKREILRGEVAEMLYRMLVKANLIG